MALLYPRFWVFLCVVAYVQSFSYSSTAPRATNTHLFERIPANPATNTRRHALFGLLTATAVMPLPSWALKPRNEELCGTGLFTNFLEYRCTEIGDISDEGQRTGLSSSEAGAADSLLSKLELDLPMEEDGSESKKKKDKSNDDTSTTKQGP